MATEKKYVSLQKLGLYHEKEVARVASVIAASEAATKAYADSLATNYDAAGAAATVQANLEAEIARAQAAEAAALKAGQDAQADVDALETYVGTIPETATATDVVGYIEEKTAGIATDAALAELQGKVTQAEKDIDAIEADYLKAADKTELAEAIEAEANRAKGIEGGLETRLKAVEDDYLKAADKAELAGDISENAEAIAAVKEDVDAFFKDADMTESAKDTLKELQEYIASDESGASAMAASIKANADAIDAVESRMDTAEGKITAVEGVAADNAAAIEALEAKFGEGEGSVADLIADAVAVETQAREQAIAEVQEDADKGIADAAAALEAAQNADAKAVSLNEVMEGRVAALEAIDHEHANKALLDTYTQTEADLADAVAKKHAHANSTVLDGITAAQVAAWDAAEANAKAHADSLNTAMDARVTANTEAIAAFVEVSEEEINALFA